MYVLFLAVFLVIASLYIMNREVRFGRLIIFEVFVIFFKTTPLKFLDITTIYGSL